MANRLEAGGFPNPFDSAQRVGRDPTVKWCLYEVLARHYRHGARVAELEKDERLLALRPKMRAAKNLNGQITGELGSDKGVHFIKDFNGQPGVWGVRLDAARAAAAQPLGGSATAAAEAQQQGASSTAALPPQDVHQQQQQAAGQSNPPAARGNNAGAATSPSVPGNQSEAAPWAGATCQYLTDRLWKKGAAVWWPAEQQYFNGKIVETLSEEGSDLLLLHVLYDDQTDEWVRPTRFKVSGGKEQTVVVITENEVYIRDEESGRLVPDPNQGVDPAALGGTEAAGEGSPAAGGSAGAAAQAATGRPGAGQRQEAQQGAPQQQAQHDRQQQLVRPASSQSSEGRRPHAARAPVDIPTKGSWWQKAVVDDETRALELQKQRTSSSEEQQQEAAAGGGAQQAQREGQWPQQEGQRPQQQAQRLEGQQQERKRKLSADEAAVARQPVQHGKPQAQQSQHPGQRPQERQHGEKRQRRDSGAAEERAVRPPIPRSTEPQAPKFFSIPKRPQAEQAPPKQQAAGADEGSKAVKGAGGSTPFRIPKAATGPAAAGSGSAGPGLADQRGGKRQVESAEHAPDRRRPPQPQRPVDAEHAQWGQAQQRSQQQPAAPPHHAQQQRSQKQPQQQGQQQQHAPRGQQQQQQQQQQNQQHAHERQQQRQARARSPEAARRADADTRELLLRQCKADIHRRMGTVRWAAPAERVELPMPRLEHAAAAALAAVLAPHKADLAERLAAGGAWPHGDVLLPAADSRAASLAGTPAAAPAQAPEDAQFGRIFVCKRSTTSACFQRNVFVSNSDIDLQGLQPGSLALLHSLDEKLVYGVFKVVECGTNLDPAFPADAAFKYHVRVQALHLFQPVPDMLLDTFVERKVHPKTGQRMKFFDRHLNARQCRQIWSLMHHYNEKLHDSRDTLWRMSPLTPAGAGFWEAWQRQAAQAAGGGGGGGGGQKEAA